MNTFFQSLRRIIHPALLLALAFVVASSAWAAEPLPPKDRTVILISLDGFPAWLWNDPTLPIPNLRRLAGEGAQAEAMTVSNPSVTWINHTTLVTGVNPSKHGVLFNGRLVRQGPDQPPQIEQWADKADLVRVPTLYDLAFNAGLKTAQVDWVAILNSGTITDEFLEVPRVNGRIERELIGAGKLTAADLAVFNKGRQPVWRDQAWTDAAVHILRTRKPNLLLVHLLNLDSTNHTYGPGTSASHTAYAYADRCVADLLATINEAGFRDKATVVITTDHGFKKVDKHIFPNVALRKAGLVTVEAGKVARCDAYIMPQGGLAFAYVTDPSRRAELLPRLRAVCEKIEGVDRVLDGSRGPELGMPTPDQNQGMGDLILYAKAGYAFQAGAIAELETAEAKGYLGSHGYPSTDPELDGIFLAWGYGIRPGVRIPRVANLDVAPTLAELLGVTLPPTDGRVLTEILEPNLRPARR